MANALVVHKSKLPQAQRSIRAAQYVRMSTDYQKYSIANQAAAIAAYAQLHGLSIVRTYRDEGESGLRIKNRAGLTQLIADVQSGEADFGHILVFDVSRWGRFQDTDESAHYEFICKQAGIQVTYCAEQFDNDGSLISSIVKNIKRVMAAEYSRELSAKVHAGQVRLARLGFRMGGRVGYGLERLVVDEKSEPRGVLADGEQKFLATDHVRVRPGGVEERAVVQWIFEEYLRGKPQAYIWRELNRRGVPRRNGRPWNNNSISFILRNESYIGNLVFNRVSRKLHTKRIVNPSDLWIRSEGCIEPIIDQDAFFRTKKRMEEYRVMVSEEEMLARLRKLLMKKGKLTVRIINGAVGVPHYSTYQNHFGSLRNVYRLIGYNKTQFWKDLAAHERWTGLNYANAVLLREAFEKVGEHAVFDASIRCLRVNDRMSVGFGVAKWAVRKDRQDRWSLRSRMRWPAGWIVAPRLSEDNGSILDYILLRTPAVPGNNIWMSEENCLARNIERFATFDELTQSLLRRVKDPTPCSSTRPRSKAIVKGTKPKRK